ncbi:MAG: endonuclease domain-containing protein, partial [Ignavibacteria bacterium]|nr:endonuclease domain-containing protein [Ignavibacteria bacterium]
KWDLDILLYNGCYRIPVKTKLEDLFKVKYLAFYQSHAFGKFACIIKHYGTIDKIKVCKRFELFPNEKPNPKSDYEYYKIRMKDMNILENPIPSKRSRRIIFISTTLKKLLDAKEVNDLFNDSPLEDKMWSGLKENNIVAERQFPIVAGKNLYSLDFAAFCKKGSVNIECDGDAYHIGKDNAVKDNKRDNFLTRKGWSILRYSTSQLEDMGSCISEIYETIKRHGGLEK